MKKDLKQRFGEGVEELLDGKVETAEFESGENLVIIDDTPAFAKENGELLPLIFITDRLDMKRVTVDMGAVKHISNGADVMAPGIIEVDDDIQKGDNVAIDDEKNNKILAIGEALEKSGGLKGEEGKVIKTLHYAGDRFWELKEEF